MKEIYDVEFKPDNPKHFSDNWYHNCNLKGNGYSRGSFIDCIFEDCDISMARFSNATIKNCKFINCNMQFCNMLKAHIENCEFVSCDFHHSNMCHSVIKDSSFQSCIIKALFKDLDWTGNTFDPITIIESCGGEVCGMDNNVVENIRRNNEIVPRTNDVE